MIAGLRSRARSATIRTRSMRCSTGCRRRTLRARRRAARLHRERRRPAAVALARPRSGAHAADVVHDRHRAARRDARPKCAKSATHPVIKVKLGRARRSRRSRRSGRSTRGTMRIDANEAWTPESAVTMLRELERFDIEFCEQPIPAGTPEQLRWIRERTVDPDRHRRRLEGRRRSARAAPAASTASTSSSSKCGGIRGALAMIHTARALRA